ncbi:MAG: metallophosphoesterase family protein [Myxococcota bacterium]
MPLRVAIFSDTHNLLRPALLTVLERCEIWIHAGDICRLELWELLRVRAGTRLLVGVRGNNDKGAWAEQLPLQTEVMLRGWKFLVLHELHRLSREQLEQGTWHGVISGHSHQRRVHWEAGKLLLNPGSAGPRRFKLEPSMMVLELEGSKLVLNSVLLEPVSLNSVSLEPVSLEPVSVEQIRLDAYELPTSS